MTEDIGAEAGSIYRAAARTQTSPELVTAVLEFVRERFYGRK